MRSESDTQFSPLINLLLSGDTLAMIYGFCILISAQFFQQRRTVPSHPHCPTYSSLLALKHPTHSILQDEETHWGWLSELTEAEPENHGMKSRGSLRSTREFCSSGVWCKALSPHSSELQFLCSPEAGTLSLQTVSLGKSVINCNMFLLIIANHTFSKTAFLACPRWGDHLLTDFKWMLQSLGVLEQLKENATIFFSSVSYFLFRNSWIVGWPFPKTLSRHRAWKMADCMVRSGKFKNNTRQSQTMGSARHL